MNTPNALVIRTQTKSGSFKRRLVAESIGESLSYTALSAFITVFAVNGETMLISLNRSMLTRLTTIGDSMDDLVNQEHKG